MSAEIRHLGDPATHFWLTRSVARVMGVNLSEAMAMERLSAADYADMVNRCRTCPHVSTCQQWLGERRMQAAPAPDHCMHYERLSRLSRGEHA